MAFVSRFCLGILQVIERRPPKAYTTMWLLSSMTNDNPPRVVDAACQTYSRSLRGQNHIIESFGSAFLYLVFRFISMDDAAEPR